MNRQEKVTARLNKELDACVSNYVQRVTALTDKRDNDQGKVAEIFKEINTRWVRQCTAAKRPLQTRQFAMEVQNLNEQTIEIERRIRFDYNLGRFLFWFLVLIILGGLALFFYGVYWIYSEHLQYVFTNF